MKKNLIGAAIIFAVLVVSVCTIRAVDFLADKIEGKLNPPAQENKEGLAVCMVTYTDAVNVTHYLLKVPRAGEFTKIDCGKATVFYLGVLSKTEAK